MHRAWWASCLWPGLPQLWLRGAPSGLAVAVGFTLLANFTFVLSYGWTGLATPAQRGALWFVVGAVWLGSAAANYLWWLRQANESVERSSPGLFQEALDGYLRGDWLAAEAGFDRLLAADPRDADALLMLATLYRHTRRYDEARAALSRLERLDAAQKWQLEMDVERQRLAEVDAESDDQREPEAADGVSVEIADAA